MRRTQYGKEIYYNKKNPILVFLLSLCIIITGVVLTYFIVWVIQNITKIIFIFMFILLTIHIIIYRKRKKERKELIYKVTKEIKRFEPSINYSWEEGYHGELQGWLKSKFPNSKAEVQTGASRPDIVIGNIAIEVKGNTDDNDLATIGNKCIKYLQHYKHLIIVLFNPSFSRRNYDELTTGIKKNFPNVKMIIK